MCIKEHFTDHAIRSVQTIDILLQQLQGVATEVFPHISNRQKIDTIIAGATELSSVHQRELLDNK